MKLLTFIITVQLVFALPLEETARDHQARDHQATDAEKHEFSDLLKRIFAIPRDTSPGEQDATAEEKRDVTFGPNDWKTWSTIPWPRPTGAGPPAFDWTTTIVSTKVAMNATAAVSTTSTPTSSISTPTTSISTPTMSVSTPATSISTPTSSTITWSKPSESPQPGYDGPHWSSVLPVGTGGVPPLPIGTGGLPSLPAPTGASQPDHAGGWQHPKRLVSGPRKRASWLDLRLDAPAELVNSLWTPIG